MHTLITICLAAAATLCGSGALAKPILTFQCEVPVGNRFDEVGGRIQEAHDDFTDVHPVFVLDDERPGKLLLVFPPTKGARDLGMKAIAEEATVVSNTNEKITAVQVGSAGADVVEMYSLYPAKGLLFYTRHVGRVPGSATFHASCTVARS